MARVQGDLTINCPVETVFDLAADERSEPAYDPELVRVDRLTDGPVGVGTRFPGAPDGRPGSG